MTPPVSPLLSRLDEGNLNDAAKEFRGEATHNNPYTFRGHDRTHTTKHPEHCHQAPGAKRSPRPVQLFDKHYIFRPVTGGSGDISAILVHPMGVGRRHRLVVITANLVNKTPQSHASASGRYRCQNSLGRDDGLENVPLPSVSVAQAMRDAGAFFEPKVVLAGLRRADGARTFVRFADCVAIPDIGHNRPTNLVHSVCVDFDLSDERLYHVPAKTRTRPTHRADGVEYFLDTVDAADYPMNPATVVLPLSVGRISSDTNWKNEWTSDIALNMANGHRAGLRIAGMSHFSPIICDAASNIRSVKSNAAKVLSAILPSQYRSPITVTATAGLSTDNSSGMTLRVSLIRDKTTYDDIIAVRSQVHAADASLRSSDSADARMEAAAAVETETHDCIVDDKFASTLEDLTATVGRSVFERLLSARAANGFSRTNRRKSNLSVVEQDKGMQKLGHVIHLLGLLEVGERAEADGHPIPTVWSDSSPTIRRGFDKNYPRAYLRPVRGRHLGQILAPCSRLRKLRKLRNKAFHAVELWFAKSTNKDKFAFELSHAGQSATESQQPVQGSRTFCVEDSAPKSKTKALVPTHALRGTSLDCLHVANHYVLFSVTNVLLHVMDWIADTLTKQQIDDASARRLFQMVVTSRFELVPEIDGILSDVATLVRPSKRDNKAMRPAFDLRVRHFIDDAINRNAAARLNVFPTSSFSGVENFLSEVNKDVLRH
ncbi:hypothetical protein CkaCkLH20_01994 [Colletotrichum karsti]|uniref:Uncharacterized protein n=1 Tax=Colletotrichum karsti TaxID=1095194 RepID=A0A9P6LQP3_9PEZI|nr:uncharacterized protein CkaCkLH20_01994 [Colletotrichum karsti]KAF9880952.1 hypothetical protein CkaCkLH20_01994 [Colletotrichum karsti]